MTYYDLLLYIYIECLYIMSYYVHIEYVYLTSHDSKCGVLV